MWGFGLCLGEPAAQNELLRLLVDVSQMRSEACAPPLGSEKQGGAVPAASQSSVVGAPLDAPVRLHRSRGGSVYTDWLLLSLREMGATMLASVSP